MRQIRSLSFLLAIVLWAADSAPGAIAVQSNRSLESERERNYLRMLFQKSFKDIQVISQKLLRDHEASALTPEQLGKNARNIQRSAKTLRTLMRLEDLARTVEVNRTLDTPKQFDDAIRRLAEVISQFAHNPVHQNTKVLNQSLAEQAQTDLLTIINLSKALSDKSKGYATLARQGP